MKAFFSINRITFLALTRSYVFQTVLAFLLLCVIGLPMLLSGDGTALSHIKLSIDYTLSFVTFILVFSILWTSCTVMNSDRDKYQLHLVVVKPVSKVTVWLGKFFSILVTHTLLLFISMAVLYLVLHFNLNSSTYTQKQREKVYNKILTGRKTIKHDFSGLKQLYRKNWKEKLAALKKSGEVLTDRNKKELRQEIYFQTLTNSGQVEPGKSSEFIFKNIKEDSLTNIILKFRIFVGNIKMISKQNKPKAAGAWEIFDPRTKKYNKIKGSLQDYTSNIFYELKLPAGCLSKDGTAKLRYINKAESVSVFFQITESPVLYITEVPFLNNYLRAFIVIFLSLVLITGLGCALGGVFSFPIAVITVAAYLVIGSISNFVTLSSKSALDIKKEQSFEKSLTDFLLSVIIPLSRFDTSDELSSGILIEKSKIFDLLFFLILCKEFPLLFLCIYIYSKKELGLITKK